MSRGGGPGIPGSPADAAEPFTADVALPPGVARVRVDRRGLALAQRGGFEAAWLRGAEDPLSLESFRLRVRAQLAALYAREAGAAAPTALLNLASHQLVDDLRGWARLNEAAWHQGA